MLSNPFQNPFGFTLAVKPETLRAALTTLHEYQQEVAVHAVRMLRDVLAPHKDKISEVWVERSTDLQSVKIYIQHKKMDLDTFEQLHDLLSNYECTMTNSLPRIDPRWNVQVDTMSFRHDEQISAYTGFNPERAARVEL